MKKDQPVISALEWAKEHPCKLEQTSIDFIKSKFKISDEEEANLRKKFFSKKKNHSLFCPVCNCSKTQIKGSLENPWDLPWQSHRQYFVNFMGWTPEEIRAFDSMHCWERLIEHALAMTAMNYPVCRDWLIKYFKGLTKKQLREAFKEAGVELSKDEWKEMQKFELTIRDLDHLKIDAEEMEEYDICRFNMIFWKYCRVIALTQKIWLPLYEKEINQEIPKRWIHDPVISREEDEHLRLAIENSFNQNDIDPKVVPREMIDTFLSKTKKCKDETGTPLKRVSIRADGDCFWTALKSNRTECINAFTKLFFNTTSFKQLESEYLKRGSKALEQQFQVKDHICVESLKLLFLSKWEKQVDFNPLQIFKFIQVSSRPYENTNNYLFVPLIQEINFEIPIFVWLFYRPKQGSTPIQDKRYPEDKTKKVIEHIPMNMVFDSPSDKPAPVNSISLVFFEDHYDLLVPRSNPLLDESTDEEKSVPHEGDLPWCRECLCYFSDGCCGCTEGHTVHQYDALKLNPPSQLQESGTSPTKAGAIQRLLDSVQGSNFIKTAEDAEIALKLDNWNVSTAIKHHDFISCWEPDIKDREEAKKHGCYYSRLWAASNFEGWDNHALADMYFNKIMQVQKNCKCSQIEAEESLDQNDWRVEVACLQLDNNKQKS